MLLFRPCAMLCFSCRGWKSVLWRRFFGSASAVYGGVRFKLASCRRLAMLGGGCCCALRWDRRFCFARLVVPLLCQWSFSACTGLWLFNLASIDRASITYVVDLCLDVTSFNRSHVPPSKLAVSMPSEFSATMAATLSLRWTYPTVIFFVVNQFPSLDFNFVAARSINSIRLGILTRSSLGFVG